jgi:hypothetical protein
MNVLESKGAMLMDGENMRILLIPVERDGVKIVSLIIVRKQERDYLELSRSLLPESGQEITLTVLGRDGSMLIVLVRNCGSQYYFMSYESKSIARDNRA